MTIWQDYGMITCFQYQNLNRTRNLNLNRVYVLGFYIEKFK
jgi:hypothetical protein